MWDRLRYFLEMVLVPEIQDRIYPKVGTIIGRLNYVSHPWLPKDCKIHHQYAGSSIWYVSVFPLANRCCNIGGWPGLQVGMLQSYL